MGEPFQQQTCCGSCRKERDGHLKLATKVWEKVPELLAADTPEDKVTKELELWVKVLEHRDNLDAVKNSADNSMCLMYNEGLCNAFLTAANNGKKFAVPLLNRVFRFVLSVTNIMPCCR